ncbi:MgtC/SapB family protein [Pyrodictium abyssi]|uniref:MgtC/SapB family protein n=1 Tax=Pyrodictium abyssi TaxID=54256 RepID=A0ABN6ZPH3_9CREN|nr:MgtC/SapB family protein [Pyrodictium abyssi]
MASGLADGVEADLLGRVIVAFLSGMLIGIEREKARAALARRRQRGIGIEELVVKEFPGIRTFSLVAVYAAVIGVLWSRGLLDSTHVSVLLIIFGIIAAIFSAHRLLVARMAGITTIVVLMVDFAVGLLAGLGEILLAASVAVLTTFILAIKLPAERMVGRIRYEELLWALELGVILVVVGPLLFMVEYEFYGVSLRSLYLFFALVLATSYIGYIMARIKGGEGIAYASLFGGLANSEATLMALLTLIPSSLRRELAFHIAMLTNSAMILRNMVIAVAAAYLVGNSYLQLGDLAPLLVAATAAMVPAFLSWRHSLRIGTSITAVRIENPLRFTTAAKSTILYLVITFVSYLLQHSSIASLVLVVVAGGFVSSSATILALFSIGGLAAVDLARLAIVATIAGVLNKVIYAYLVDTEPETIRRVALACVLQAVLMILGLVVNSA